MFLYSPGLQETQAVPFDVSPLGHCTQFTLLPSENALWKPSTHLHACPAGPFLTVVLMLMNITYVLIAFRWFLIIKLVDLETQELVH